MRPTGRHERVSRSSPDEREQRRRGATTDADGIYTIVGLADGDYTVYAQSDWAGNLLGVVYPGSRDWDDAQDVHVSGAETVRSAT